MGCPKLKHLAVSAPSTPQILLQQLEAVKQFLGQVVEAGLEPAPTPFQGEDSTLKYSTMLLLPRLGVVRGQPALRLPGSYIPPSQPRATAILVASNGFEPLTQGFSDPSSTN